MVTAKTAVFDDAKKATESEHKMSLWQGVKLYPKAVAWSILISTCIAMEGYDVCLLSNFYAFPQFNRKYGEQLPDGTYQIPAPWQAGLTNGANVGEIIGLFINGWASEKFGYRYTVMTCLVLIAAFTAIFFTAQTVVHLQVAEILCGIPWGVFQTLTITYASEVCPVALRGYLTTYVNFCWGLGQVVGIGVIKSMLPRDDQWSYRIPYALQWMWPVPLFIGIYLAPESPWWLVRKGRTEDAKKSLLRLTSLDRETDFDADETIAMMVHTTALEDKVQTCDGTEIICMVWAIQNLSGNAFSGPYISTVLCSLFTMLMIMGFLGLVPDSHRDQASMATGSIMLVWALSYQLSVGTVAYSLVAELSTRRLQIKTVYVMICLGPGEWNWSNFTGFFWAGLCFLCIIYTYFRIPEPRGRTFAELDLLFEKGVPARKFATTDIDVFEESVSGDMVKTHELVAYPFDGV
ncbi:MFS transporter [Flagelloscypha sp. PMI_526]|nr:MFS transporter [Flagelloscypha sp. PMI_526]